MVLTSMEEKFKYALSQTQNCTATGSHAGREIDGRKEGREGWKHSHEGEATGGEIC
jgi:hypothetical protein